MSFEDSMKRLEEIVVKLESGECGLDEATLLFGEGKQLAETCAKSLDENKGKIVELVEQLDGIVEKSLK